MIEYIIKDSALQAVGDVHPLDYNGQGIKRRIEKIPPVDAVRVVRCRNCKYRYVYEGSDGETHKECELDTTGPYALGRNAEDDDWYCADGERRHEEPEE